MTATTTIDRAAPARVRLGRELRQLARPYRARLTAVAVGVLVAALLDLVGPLVVRHLIDDNLTPHRTAGLTALAVIYLAAIAAGQVVTAGYGYLAATVAQRALAGLRTRLFGHVLALPTGYHDRTPIGDAISRATADVETIDDLFSSSAATLLGETVRLLTVTATMLILSPVLTAVAALVLPPLYALTSVLRGRIREAERATRSAVGGLNIDLQEDLTGVDVIRAYGRQAAFAAQFRDTLTRLLAASNLSTRFNAVYAPALGVLSAAATAALLWFGGQGGAHAIGVSVGTLTAFVLLFARFFTPLINLGDEWQNVQAALAGGERVYTVLAIPTDEPVTLNGAPHQTGEPVAAHPVVEMQRVTFSYTDGRPVLHDIELAIGAGEHVALVGRSGAGKTTILALLAGLYRPATGRVALDRVDPALMTDRQRQQLLGYVPQTAQLFTGTVRDNLTFADPSISNRQIERAARIAGAEAFITALPDGYLTGISDTARGTGVQLSAGQRQLLALARALVTCPAVLLLDEATAVIDGASDATFRAALRDHVQPAGTAIVTVAHRLSTARDADRVIVLAAGRILEQGPPAHLLAAGGLFAALCAIEDAGWDWQHGA